MVQDPRVGDLVLRMVSATAALVSKRCLAYEFAYPSKECVRYRRCALIRPQRAQEPARECQYTQYLVFNGRDMLTFSDGSCAQTTCGRRETECPRPARRERRGPAYSESASPNHPDPPLGKTRCSDRCSGSVIRVRDIDNFRTVCIGTRLTTDILPPPQVPLHSRDHSMAVEGRAASGTNGEGC